MISSITCRINAGSIAVFPIPIFFLVYSYVLVSALPAFMGNYKSRPKVGALVSVQDAWRDEIDRSYTAVDEWLQKSFCNQKSPPQDWSDIHTSVLRATCTWATPPTPLVQRQLQDDAAAAAAASEDAAAATNDAAGNEMGRRYSNPVAFVAHLVETDAKAPNFTTIDGLTPLHICATGDEGVHIFLPLSISFRLPFSDRKGWVGLGWGLSTSCWEADPPFFHRSRLGIVY